MLRFIQYNKEYFTSVGLLLPSFLASLYSHMVYEELRLVLSTDDEYQNKYQFSTSMIIRWSVTRAGTFLLCLVLLMEVLLRVTCSGIG